MKNFKVFINEVHTSHQDLALDNNRGMADGFGNPSVRRKLNTWVGAIAGSYVLPEDAIARLRHSLAKIGLSFGEATILEDESGSMSLPLTSFGGRFGKGLNTPHDEFETDDGISHIVEGGLTLVIDYSIKEDNSYHLHARIE
jgi:hypothetical protein|tara:strand:- start:1675 stop:2100 length:426 start_codon:yes stop_codon:yes gene_type:complete